MRKTLTESADPGHPREEELQRLSEFFKMFADPARLRTLCLLEKGELCVGELAQRAGMTQSAVSHQLKLLRSMGLVRFRRVGKHLVYTLADEHVGSITKKGLEHVRE